MKEIVDRLIENRQIEVAKSILESNGYNVEKVNEDQSSLAGLKKRRDSLHKVYQQKSDSYKELTHRQRKILDDIIKEIFSSYRGEYEVLDKGALRGTGNQGDIDGMIDSLQSHLNSLGWSTERLAKGRGIKAHKENVADLLFTPWDAANQLEIWRNDCRLYTQEYQDISKSSEIARGEYQKARDEYSRASNDYDTYYKSEIAPKIKAATPVKLSWSEPNYPGQEFPEYHADYKDYHIIIYDCRSDGDSINYEVLDKDTSDQLFISDDFRSVKAAKTHAAKYVSLL